MSPKTANEWKEYRKSHGERINQNRKARRLEKLEFEKLRLMKPLDLETAAPSAKTEQQSINTHQSADNSSLAQERELPPVPIAQEQEFAMVSGLSFVAQLPKQPALWVVPQPDCTSEAVSIKRRGSVAQLPDSDKISSESEMIAQLREISRKLDQHKKIAQETETKQIAQSVWPLLKSSPGLLMFSLAVLIFLAANTFFLVTEQASLYESLGYSAVMALIIAVITEAALILFSAASSWATGFWKVILHTGCLGTGIVIIGLLNSAVDNRILDKMASSETAEMLKKDIRTQEALEDTALEMIGNLDPKLYPTKIRRLKAQLNSPGFEGHTFRLGQLREKLATLSVSGNLTQEVRVLQWQRWASMGWNILLAGFLGYLWRRKFSTSC